jgi:hypothetical protein
LLERTSNRARRLEDTLIPTPPVPFGIRPRSLFELVVIVGLVPVKERACPFAVNVPIVA